MPLVPASLSFNAEGIPFSTAFDDVYHSSDGGFGQARHVFLDGNALPARWRGRQRFTILETGFGLGLNFLATWAAWRDDPAASETLHFVSCELHPFRREDLARLHATLAADSTFPAFASLAAQLQGQWPELVPGLHRLHLDGGRVTLTLAFGDATEGLRQLQARADALYLDGFSPAKNQALWSEEVCRQLARLAAPDATLATWSVAGEVRHNLIQAGFAVDKAPGFGGKRQMLRGRLAAAADALASPPPAETPPAGHALVVGAGLAGTSIAERLAARGWRVDLIETGDAPGQGASGNHAGVLRPLPSLDDNRLARLTRAGALYGLRHLRRLAEQGLPVRWAASGVLHLARDARHEEKQRATVEHHRYPESYLRYVSRSEASDIARWPLAHGGWWFPGGAWVQPPSLCAANLAAWPGRIHAHFGQAMHALRPAASGWQAVDAHGVVIAEAPVAILANGVAIAGMAEAAALPVRSARGQVAHLPATVGQAPDVVVCRLGYVSPAVDGMRCAGASFSVDDDETALRDTDHADNLAKLDFILPGYGNTLPPSATQVASGRVGFRPASPDRLPMVGAVPLSADALPPDTPLADIPRQPGLYAASGFGARGLVWASLVAEHLASQLHGDPSPLPRDLAEAIDPARYLLRQHRRRNAGAPRQPED